MKRTPWVVFGSGAREMLEGRARAYFDRLELTPPMYLFHAGSKNYHAIYGVEDVTVGTENSLAEELSVASGEPVYAIDLTSDEPTVLVFRNGMVDVDDQLPEELARSLGAPMPGEPEVPTSRSTMRSIALVEAVDRTEARNALQAERGRPVPASYHFEQCARGVLVSSDTGDVGFAATSLSERFPTVTVYGIISSRDLSDFTVFLNRGGECVGHFSIPPSDDPFCPSVNSILGETSSDKILKQLGVPRELLTASPAGGTK